jgi:hypothetical protein
LLPVIGTSRRELFQALESHGEVVLVTKPWTAMASDSHSLAATVFSFQGSPDAQSILESGDVTPFSRSRRVTPFSWSYLHTSSSMNSKPASKV